MEITVDVPLKEYERLTQQFNILENIKCVNCTHCRRKPKSDKLACELGVIEGLGGNSENFACNKFDAVLDLDVFSESEVVTQVESVAIEHK